MLHIEIKVCVPANCVYLYVCVNPMYTIVVACKNMYMHVCVNASICVWIYCMQMCTNTLVKCKDRTRQLLQAQL